MQSKGNLFRTINTYAGKYRLGYTTIAINNFVIVVEVSEEKAIKMKKTGVLLKVAPLGSLQ